ncbi:Na+/H+ antiporter subunit E [Roseinatronobacter monicus]|uniref:Multisubunit sodium/proton antiporter MrpE subunit n=1 Tax=Roseinatronobacter monicus TaxID=393481 RepID=A0A543KGI6_9RHOB|nr:Na+/H+ antiporter subunit E [Roseinatronobacter monicus]TQM94162.1 multisubunit sodium/proton antiporter MrpE subunit [Roseinatronobacter monicus]
MRATSPLRLNASARVQSLTLADRQDLPPTQAAQPVPATRSAAKPGRRQVLRQVILSILVLSVMWGALTSWRVEALIFGLPAIALGAMVSFLLPPTSGFRLSLRGAMSFALWFAVQSVRGAVDVALRAFSPDMGLRPCFRIYPFSLPMGAPRITFVNIITLLPGTLSAEINDDVVIVHMLDARIELEPALVDLETRIRALFALPQTPEHLT